MALKNQDVFIVFFAIFWGLIANVQPRWKAFQWPLVFRLKVVFKRVLLAFFVMNILPVVYFGLTLWVINNHPVAGLIGLVFQGVLPAFGMFGLYRLWLAIVEFKPSWFYMRESNDIPEPYRHVEPTYRLSWNEPKVNNLPIVDLAEGAWFGNLLAALFYLALATLVPCMAVCLNQ